MDIPTKNLAKHVKEKGINLSKMSRDTRIPYTALYDSLLNDDRDRDLRAGEMFMVCRFLGVNPMDFASEAEKKGE